MHRLLPSPLSLAVACAVLLSSCASTDGLTTQGHLHDAGSQSASRALGKVEVSDAAWPDDHWWSALGDPQLDALVDEALAASPAIEAADARTRKAVAQAGLADAMRKPTLGAGAYRRLGPDIDQRHRIKSKHLRHDHHHPHQV